MANSGSGRSIAELSGWGLFIRTILGTLKLIGVIVSVMVLAFVLFFIIIFSYNCFGSSGLCAIGAVWAEEFIPRVPILGPIFAGTEKVIETAVNPETLLTNKRISSRMEDIRTSEQQLKTELGSYTLDNLNGLYDEGEKIESSALFTAENTFENSAEIEFSCQLKGVDSNIFVDLPGIETATETKGTITLEPGEKKVVSVGCVAPDGVENFDKELAATPVRLIFSHDYIASSFVKIYTLTEERQKELRLQDIDPFEGIEDIDLIKQEEGIYTVRPVSSKNAPEKIAIEIGASQPLKEDEWYKLKVALTSDTYNWQGHIRELKDVYLLIPSGVILSSEECDFKDTGEAYEDFNVIQLAKYSLKQDSIDEFNKRCENIPDLFNDECFDLLLGRVSFDCKFKLDRASEEISHDYTLWAETLYSYEDFKSRIATTQKSNT